MAHRELTRETIAGFSHVLTDGGWGTELQRRGGRPGECFELWNLTQPERVLEVAKAYVDAGSDIVLTNSFGASSVMLGRHGYAGEAKAINRTAAELSREAAGDRVLVFGSLGPSGKMPSLGEIEEQPLREAFREQARALVEGGVDGLVLETMSDLAEAELAMDLLRGEFPVPFGVSMTFDSGPDKLHTLMGVTPAALIQAAENAGAAFVGANCGLGVEQYLRLARVFQASTSLPLWFKPNAGLPVLEDNRVVYQSRPEGFASLAFGFFAAGASMVGGCCGTTPEFIRALRQTIDQEGADPRA
jgi:5-methyltetrahydrofolate--homocysteine methyltransferase